MFIDLSNYNTVTNYKAVASKVDACIIRAGYRGYKYGNIVKDAMFERHVKGCKNNNIPFGLYFMSQAINNAEAIEEADYVCKLAKDTGARLPIFIDSEWSNKKKDGRADGLSKSARTTITVTFCNRVRENGLVAGVYASTSWFISHLDVSKLMSYKIWCAQYNTKCTATHRVDAWQFTSRGTLDGITGYVDMSVDYSMGVTVCNPYPVPTRILKNKLIKMRGDDVKFVQYEVGAKIDGIYGAETEEKVKNYQLVHALKIDGIAGEQTVGEMLKGKNY